MSSADACAPAGKESRLGFIRRQIARFQAWRAGRKDRALRAAEQDAVLEHLKEHDSAASDRMSTLS